MEFAAPLYVIGGNRVGKKTIVKLLAQGNKYIECYIQSSAMKVLLIPRFVSSLDDVPTTAFGILLLYDITSEQTLDVITKSVQAIQQKVLRQPDYLPLRCIVGTHRDQADRREVQYETAAELKKQINALWFEVSQFQNVDVLLKQISIRAVFGVKQQTQALSLLPRMLIIDGTTSVSQAMLPRNFEEKLVQLLSDEEFTRQTQQSKVGGRLIEAQARDHIQESHFFGCEQFDTDLVSDPKNPADPTLVVQVVEDSQVGRKSISEGNVADELRNFDTADLSQTFRMFLSQLGTKTSDQTMENFVEAIQKTILQQPKRSVAEEPSGVNKFMTQLQQRKEKNISIDVSAASGEFKIKKMAADISSSSKDKSDYGSLYSASLLRGPRGSKGARINYSIIAQQQTQRASETEYKGFKSVVDITGFDQRIDFPEPKPAPAPVVQKISQPSPIVAPVILSTESHEESSDLQEAKQKPSRLGNKQSDADEDVIMLSEIQSEQTSVVKQDSISQDDDLVQMANVVRRAPDRIVTVLSHGAPKIHASLSLIQTAQNTQRVTVDGQIYVVELKATDNAFDTASELINKYNINQKQLKPVMIQIQKILDGLLVVKRPPKMPQVNSQKEKDRRKILFKTTVQVKNRKVEIAFRENDNPIELATQWCKMLAGGIRDVDNVTVQIQKAYSKFLISQ